MLSSLFSASRLFIVVGKIVQYVCSQYLLMLVHGVVVIIYIGVVTLQLVQLDVDDPLLVSLGHQPSILILTASIVLSPNNK